MAGKNRGSGRAKPDCDTPGDPGNGDHRFGPTLRALRSWVFPVVAAAEIFLQPYIKADEQITAAHLLKLELGVAGAPVPPGDGNDRPTVSSHDGFERQLNREIEVRRDQRTAPVNHRAAVGFESI